MRPSAQADHARGHQRQQLQLVQHGDEGAWRLPPAAARRRLARRRVGSSWAVASHSSSCGRCSAARAMVDALALAARELVGCGACVPAQGQSVEPFIGFRLDSCRVAPGPQLPTAGQRAGQHVVARAQVAHQGALVAPRPGGRARTAALGRQILPQQLDPAPPRRGVRRHAIAQQRALPALLMAPPGHALLAGRCAAQRCREAAGAQAAGAGLGC